MLVAQTNTHEGKQHAAESQQSATLFNELFYIGKATYGAQLNAVHALRHKVYCEEMSFEPVSINGLETDCYDASSEHYFVKCKSSGAMAGCIRAIRSNTHGGLPVSKLFCGKFLYPDLNPANLEPLSVTELSRLAVLSKFRSGHMEPKGLFHHEIPKALYFAAILHAAETGIKHLYITARPSLARTLHRVGLPVKCIGGSADLNGKRFPYYLDTKSAVDGFTKNCHHFLRSL